MLGATLLLETTLMLEATLLEVDTRLLVDTEVDDVAAVPTNLAPRTPPLLTAAPRDFFR